MRVKTRGKKEKTKGKSKNLVWVVYTKQGVGKQKDSGHLAKSRVLLHFHEKC